jgi:hypothetical protein
MRRRHGRSVVLGAALAAGALGACGSRRTLAVPDARAAIDAANAPSGNDGGADGGAPTPDGPAGERAAMDAGEPGAAADGPGAMVKPAMLVLSPSPVTLTARVGCPEEAELVVRNGGGAPTGEIAIALTGDPYLSATPSRCASLPAGETCRIAIRFAPGATGWYRAQVVAAADAGDAVTVNVVGVGLSGGDDLRLSPATYTFNPLAPGEVSPPFVFKVTNKGGARLPVAVSASTTSNEFVVERNGCEAGLDPGQSCEILVSFRPTSVGAKTALLSISAYSACAGGRWSASLQGLGTGPPLLTISPTTLDFGSLCLLVPASTKLFTVANKGGAPTGPLTVALAGASAAEFRLAGNCTGARLEVGNSCNVIVIPKVTSEGEKTAGVVVRDDAGASVTAPLTAFAAAGGDDHATPYSRNFGAVKVGGRSEVTTFSVTLRGERVRPVIVSVAGANAGDFQIVEDRCQPGPPPPGGCTFGVVFAPRAAGPRSAEILYSGGQPCVAIDSTPLSGEGVAP